MKGVFELRTPSDLLQKLEVDFKRVEADSLDSFAAYDFFVTAWHLVEWKHPPSSDAAGRTHFCHACQFYAFASISPSAPSI